MRSWTVSAGIKKQNFNGEEQRRRRGRRGSFGWLSLVLQVPLTAGFSYSMQAARLLQKGLPGCNQVR
jgi:hypothetical protein